MTNTSYILRNMRFSNGVKLGTICIATAIVAACSTKEAPGPIEPTGATGRVRLVNVITDATRGRVNATLEGQVFTVDLQYGQAAPANLPSPATAPYAPVYTGDRTFVLKRTADTTVTVATIPFTVGDGQDRTVYAIGGVGGSAVTSVIITDDNTAPAATETRVRVVNMSPTAGAVDVFITAIGADLATATPRVTNLAYKSASSYFSVSPGGVSDSSRSRGNSACRSSCECHDHSGVECDPRTSGLWGRYSPHGCSCGQQHRRNSTSSNRHSRPVIKGTANCELIRS